MVRSDFFERHSWIMKEAIIFSRGDVPIRTRAGVVHRNEVWVYSVTTEAEIVIVVQINRHLLEYMDLQMEALDEEHLRNHLAAY